ncbi:DNA topoisomerase I [Micractinium conductrix]|uniref:DNA topoisomerase n=1 Tax=Micractinium conductrix TaxID=554055 RepID=A0A2P6V9R4_9CHLO|nr:DNA topoisomerase I [Micractinium conductrix]|eukprot:PSC70801.1 DNA topoisomerase I [Micractinium conductrix]
MTLGSPGSILVPLKLERAEEEAALLEYAMRSSRGAVYLACSGAAASEPPTPATLDLLTQCLEPSAACLPRCDVFPLLPYLGWGPERLAQLADVEEMVAAAEHAAECRELLDGLNAARSATGLPSLSLTLTAGEGADATAAAAAAPPQQQAGQRQQQRQQQQQQQQQAGQQGQQDPHHADPQADGGSPPPEAPRGSRVIGTHSGPLTFRKVAVGGTFDRMHAGHRLLLAATALVTRGEIFVGITADALLASKKNRDLLEPYEERLAAAVGYMQLLNPGATVTAGPLSDPQEPPICATDPDFDAIVVSEETVPGAHAINQVRAHRGYLPLVIVVIGLIYSRRRATKLSSTDLREEDAASAPVIYYQAASAAGCHVMLLGVPFFFEHGTLRGPAGRYQPTTMLAVRRRGAAWLRQLATARLGSAASSTSGDVRTLAATAAAAGGGSMREGIEFAARDSSFVSAAIDAAAAGIAVPLKAKAPPRRRGAKPKAPAPAPAPPSGTVLLVESPAKAKKIQEFLGPDYTVLASYGHIRDLPARTGSVVPEAGFAMQWELLKGAEPRMASIVQAVRGARRLVLATDPDREGEAISWHLLQELQARNALAEGDTAERITFTEVTPRAVQEALAAPRQISEPLVEAYMARRALDYLYGFSLSPILWRKVPGARSAGRVQSVALRLVCEREAAVEAFVPKQYYTVEADLALPGGGALQARLSSVDGAPPPQPGFPELQQAEAVAARVAAAQWSVLEASSREQQRHPPAPFTTSTLQQEANKRLGMSASRTMTLAQQLYESGHITYMRTDGVSLAPAAVTALRAAAQADFGAASVPAEPRIYKARTKNAQEAHEAIRPTNPLLTAEQLAARGVDRPAAKLYGLIRSRALACQMASVRLSLVAAELGSACEHLRLRANASAVAFPGFLAAYFDPAAVSGGAADGGSSGAAAAGLGEHEPASEAEGDAEGAAAYGSRQQQQEAARAAAAAALAAIQRGQLVDVLNAAASEHETRPPSRYTEGTLVKHLEELGIGRPGTYAPTLNLLQQRGYVSKEGRALRAEALGRVLNGFLTSFFPKYVDYSFTSGMEELLDAVSGGEAAWQDLLSGFWAPFQEDLHTVGGVAMSNVIDRLNEALGEQLIGKDRLCPLCSSPLSLKFSSKHKSAPFVGCSSYPECHYSRPIAAPWAPDELPRQAEAGGDADVGGGQGKGEPTLPDALPEGFTGYARLLGVCPDSGKQVFVRAGLFGPYVQRGLEGEPLFRRTALSKPASQRRVTLETALALLAFPKDLGPNPATGESVIVATGKFGPFIRCGAMSRAVPKNYDAVQLSLAGALQILATKSRSQTTKEERKSVGLRDGADNAAKKAVAAAVAAAEAAAAAMAAEANAAEKAAAAATKRRPGRPATMRAAPGEAAANKAAKAAAKEAVKAAERLRKAEIKAERARQRVEKAQEASISTVRPTPEMRMALDDAADVELVQLQALLGVATQQPAAVPAEPKAPVINHRGRPTAYNMFVKMISEEARRTGHKPWGGAPLGVGYARIWNNLSEAEKEPYAVAAAEKRLEAAMRREGLLGADESLAGLAEDQRRELNAQRERAAAGAAAAAEQEAKSEQQQQLEELMSLRLSAVLRRPRSAYNIFMDSQVLAIREELKREAASSGDMLLRVAERWRSAPLVERQLYKRQAMEERRQYHEHKSALAKRQQEATADALAAGADPLTAARAGIEATPTMGPPEATRTGSSRTIEVPGKREKTQTLLKDQLELHRVKQPDGSSRYSIKPLETEFSFDKGFFMFIRAIQLLTQHNKDTIVVGLAGPSGSGKTAFSAKIKSFIPGCALMSMDNYNDGSKVIDGNFDDPRITDYDTLLANIADLKAGRCTQVPIYDFKTSSRVGYRTVEVPESRVVILEGIYALNTRLRPMLDLRVSITGGVHFDLVKRVLRDINRSGQAPEEIIQQISDTVYPMYKAFIEPDLKAAHLRIYNTFNPFSGFMSPTYILKSASPVSKEAVVAVLKPDYTVKPRESETYDIYLVPPGEDPETCQSWLRMRYRDGRYNLMFEEWVVEGHFIISPRVTFEVPVRILGGLMALGYEIGSIMRRTSEVYADSDVQVKFDHIEGMDTVYVQIHGKEREAVEEVGKRLGLEGSYIPHSYIELVQIGHLTESFQMVTEDLKKRFAVNGEPLIDEHVVGSLSRGASPHWSNGSFKRQTGFQLAPGALQLSSSAPAHGAMMPPPRPVSAANSSRGNGLLSQQMQGDGSATGAPSGPPSLSGREASAPVYINGNTQGLAGGGSGRAGSVYEPSGARSGAVTPEDAPSTRNGSKPASPKALEAQVAKLVQGQALLSNQLEELALQISLAQSGLAVVPTAVQHRAAAAAAAADQAAAGGALRRAAARLASGELPPATWAAAGALAGAAATLMFMSARR